MQLMLFKFLNPTIQTTHSCKHFIVAIFELIAFCLRVLDLRVDLTHIVFEVNNLVLSLFQSILNLVPSCDRLHC